MATKLTKTQEKAAKFKAGKKRKAAELERRDVPEEDDAADVEAQHSAAPVDDDTKQAAAKRNDTDDEEGAPADPEAAPKKKKRRRSKASSSSSVDPSKPRLIVFVGNMSFNVTQKQIADHFAAGCGETPSVRLLTRKVEPAKLSASKMKSIAKGKASGPQPGAHGDVEQDAVPMGKDGKPMSKGCAFVEFTSADALQKALRFHRTHFGGRQINVELTAGGGGKTATRLNKIKAKNSALEAERKKSAMASKKSRPGRTS